MSDHHPPPGIVRILLRTFQAALWLIAIGVIWGGWYLHNKGFSRSVRERLAAEFHKHGLDIHVHRLTLDPFQGLVASGLQIYDPAQHELLAEVSRVALDVNVGNLLRGETFLNAIDLRRARLVLPVEREVKDGPKFTVDEFNARIVFPPNQIRVTQARFLLGGVQIHATGTLLNPHRFPKRERTDDESSVAILRTIASELEKLRFPERPAVVEIEFSGDLAKPSSIEVEKAAIQSGIVERGGFRLRSVSAELTYHDGVVDIKRLEAADKGGELQFTGSYHIETGNGQFWLRSTLDIRPPVEEFAGPKPLAEITFFDPPLIEARGDIAMKQSPRFVVTGKTSFERFAIRSVIFQGFSASFALDDARVLVHDLAIQHRSGQLRAKVLHGKEDFRLELHSSLDPSTLSPLLDAKLQSLLSEWVFLDSPSIQVSAAGKDVAGGDLDVTGNILLGRTVYRGVQMDSLKAGLSMEGKAVTYKDFEIRRGEGAATGTFTYDFGEGEARLDRIVSTIPPVEAMRWVNPDLVSAVEPYRFKTPPKLEIEGVVKLGTAAGTRLKVDVDAPQGMTYKFLGKDLFLSNASAALEFVGRTLHIRDLAGRLMEGQMTAEAEISLERETPGHSAAITLAGVNFQKLTQLYFGYDESKGRLNGTYIFTGKGSDVATMRGRGQLEVIEGNVFAIPFLGPLSVILNEIVPGMGYSEAKRASATFQVEDGRLSTNDFAVDSTGFVMTGGGWVGLVEDKMDFSVRINARGIPGVLLFPVSKLFEYVSDGKRSKPAWRPKRLPRELFRQ